jgi:hypothetical protein
MRVASAKAGQWGRPRGCVGSRQLGQCATDAGGGDHFRPGTDHVPAWVWRPLIEATPWKASRAISCGIATQSTAATVGSVPDASASTLSSPRFTRPEANAIVERDIGTLRRECLDHPTVRDEQRHSRVLREVVADYNQERAHGTLGLQTPQPRERPLTGADDAEHGVHGQPSGEESTLEAL